jgi:uncharacterized protein (AIM24 family)
LPEAVVVSVAGFDQLKVTLSGTQSIYVKAGMQMEMDDTLELSATLGDKGILGAFRRAVSTGNVIQNKIAPRTSSESGEVSLFTILSGNIHEIAVTGDEVWAIHNSSYLASTENVVIESGLFLKGGMAGNGVLYSKVRLEDPTKGDGKVWVFAYGGVRTKKLDRAFRTHTGLFLAMKEHLYLKTSPTLAAPGKLGSSLFSSMGLMMSFQPTTESDEVVYMQNCNLDALFDFIQTNIQPSVVAEGATFAIADMMMPNDA